MTDDDVKALRALAQIAVGGGPDADDAVLYLGDSAPKILVMLDERDRLIAERDALAALLRDAKEAARTWENEAERRSQRYIAQRLHADTLAALLRQARVMLYDKAQKHAGKLIEQIDDAVGKYYAE
jgi:hypothetical protein